MRYLKAPKAALGLALLVQVTASSAHAAADFSGVWEVNAEDRYITPGGVAMPPREAPGRGPVFKGDYAKARDARAAAMETGAGYDEPTGRCIPQGVTRFWSGPYLYEIMQSPTQMNVFQEFNEQTRRYYIGGPSFSADAPPAYNGLSTAHWEGDVLVARTINVKDGIYLTRVGGTHSDKLTINERFIKTGPDALAVDVRVEDEEALAKPWEFTVVLKRAAKDARVMEYTCAENNR